MEKAKKDLDHAYDEEQKNYVESKIKEIKDAHINHHSRLVWDTVNEVTRRKGPKRGRIKTSNTDERLAIWKDHFQKLLEQSPEIDDQPVPKVFDTLPIKTGEFNAIELQASIKSFQNNKATGLDNIPIETWKTSCMNEKLLNVCNKTYLGDEPNCWLQGKILPVPKKEDLSIASNYREITLSSSASKIYNKMLLNRIRPILDEKLRTNQNGFRPGRSTLAQILTLRRILEVVKSKSLPAVMIFVDFDSIHRGKLMEILKAYGISLETANAISHLYKNTTAKVISPDGDTSFFPIHAGVLQGDTLAPYLFIIAVDYAMRTAIFNPDDCGFTLDKAKSRRHPALCVTDIDYADDIALLSDSVDKAEKLLHTVEMAAKLIGLHINEKKTQHMTFNQNPSKLTTINKKCIKPTNDFLYLGSWIYSNEKDVDVRIGKAWVALQKLNTSWNSNLPKKLEISIFPYYSELCATLWI